MDRNDVDKLMQSYTLIEQAQKDFLAQLISFDEYIQLCELHQINVDSYMETIEFNLKQFKLM